MTDIILAQELARTLSLRHADDDAHWRWTAELCAAELTTGGLENLMRRSTTFGPTTCCIVLALLAVAVLAGPRQAPCGDAQIPSALPGTGDPNGHADVDLSKTLHFPHDRNLGSVYTRLKRQKKDVTDSLYADWRYLAAAQGELTVPVDVEIWLEVNPADTHDLSGLAQLRPDDIDFLTLHGPEIRDASLRRVSRLTGLESLSLLRTSATDAGIAHLRSLAQLRQIEISSAASRKEGVGIGDDGVAVLAKLPKLEQIKLTGSKVTDASLLATVNMKSLRSLHLWGTQVTDRGLRILPKMPNLEELNLGGYRRRRQQQDDGGANITDEGAKSLGKIASLRRLSLVETGIGDVGILYLSRLPRLESLDVTATQTTKAGVVLVADFPRLKYFSCRRLKLTDADAARLAASPSLTILNCDTTKLSEAGIMSLAEIPNLAVLSLNGANKPITDACLTAVATMNSLRRLSIVSTQISDQGLQQFAGMTSLVSLSLLDNSKLTGESLRVLEHLPSLTRLSLTPSREPVGERMPPQWHLRHLRDSPAVEELILSARWLTDDEMANVAGMKRLKRLSIHADFSQPQRYILSNRGMRLLSGLRSLQSLKLTETRITDTGLLQVAKLKNLEYMILAGEFTDDGVMALNNLRAMRRIELSSPFITQAGLERLKQEHADLQYVVKLQSR